MLPIFFFLFKEGDQTPVSFVARALATLQHFYGAIPTIYGLGNCAKVLCLQQTVFCACYPMKYFRSVGASYTPACIPISTYA